MEVCCRDGCGVRLHGMNGRPADRQRVQQAVRCMREHMQWANVLAVCDRLGGCMGGHTPHVLVRLLPWHGWRAKTAGGS